MSDDTAGFTRERLRRLDAKMDRVIDRMMSDRLANVEDSVQSLTQRFDRMDARFARLESRVGRLENS